jgi:NADH dehydrogenase
MKTQTILIFGGNGFIGNHTVRALAKTGARLNVICRDVIAASPLKTYGDVGQINLHYGDITKPKTYEQLLSSTDLIINLVGILFEKGSRNFENIHNQAPAKLAELAAGSGVKRFIHISALGVDKATTSKYAKSKLNGEKAILQHLLNAVILRPSVVFGREDNFYNQFARMSRISPFLPLIAGGKTKFQPTYVGDVAQAIKIAATDVRTDGNIYELAGGEVQSFKQILQFVKRQTGSKSALLPIPSYAAKMIGFGSEFLPTPPLTRDQVELLKFDNIAGDGMGYKDLGITPKNPSVIVAEYL